MSLAGGKRGATASAVGGVTYTFDVAAANCPYVQTSIGVIKIRRRSRSPRTTLDAGSEWAPNICMTRAGP